jgi:ankyrin repeat protein
MSGDPNQEVIAAIHSGDRNKLRDLLSRHPSAAAARDPQGASAIMQALYRGHKDLAEMLAAANRELDIFEAAALGRTDRIAELFRVSPGPATAWSADGFTPLHFACFFAREHAAHYLLEHGAQVDAVARNATKVMPLHSAAAGRSLPIVRDLLEHGAPPNARQQAGYAALHAAAQHGDPLMVELLLQHGAQPALQNDDGITPSQLASQNGHLEIARRLAPA